MKKCTSLCESICYLRDRFEGESIALLRIFPNKTIDLTTKPRIDVYDEQ